MADLITQADIEQRIGAAELVRLLDDDGDGVADSGNVTWALTAASAIAKGILYRAFSSETKIEALVAADPGVLNDVVEIAVGLAGTRRPQLLGADGRSPYSHWRKDAEARLDRVASAKTRAIGEATAGLNETVYSNVSPTRTPLFAATKLNPTGPGGF